MTIIVDQEDLEFVSQFTWGIITRPSGLKHAYTNWGGYTIYMHCLLNGCPINGLLTDHENGNGLDNRRSNLRIVDRRLNALNSNRSRNARIVEPHGNRFRVRPFIDGVRVNLGSFATIEEAEEVAQGYKNARM